MALAEDLLAVVCAGPLLEVDTDEPFTTTRRAGDGVMRVDESGRVVYASPNAVNIMRLAGIEGTLSGTDVASLPGGEEAVGRSWARGGRSGPRSPSQVASCCTERSPWSAGQRCLSRTSPRHAPARPRSRSRRRRSVRSTTGSRTTSKRSRRCCGSRRAVRLTRGVTRTGRGGRARRFHGGSARDALDVHR